MYVYTYIMKTLTRTDWALPVLPCACANLRRAARAVTRIYDRELRVVGLEPTQYSLLLALDLKGETTQGELGALLTLDSTTLTRTLRLLIRHGWISGRQGKDRRQRILRLTPEGRKKMKQARPYWERAQRKLRKSLGELTWDQLGGLLAEVAGIATRA
jgi:DNA-binding MarR family transcriptional regulator